MNNIVINDNLDQLRDENNRLLDENKLISELLDKYRNFLSELKDICVCGHKTIISLGVKALEDEYQTITSNVIKREPIGDTSEETNLFGSELLLGLQSNTSSAQDLDSSRSQEPETTVPKKKTKRRTADNSLRAQNTSDSITNRKNDRISDEVRGILIQMMDNGMTGEDVAKHLKLNPSTVRTIYRIYRRTGLKQRLKTGKRKPKLSSDQKQTLIQWIDEDCSQSLKQLRIRCLQTWPQLKSISTMTIDRTYKPFHYSFKRKSFIPEISNSLEVIQKRREYALNFVQLMTEKEKIFFADEICVQLFSRSSNGLQKGPWSNRTRDQKYCVCAAMNCESIYFFEVEHKPQDGHHFGKRIQQLCDRLDSEGITVVHIVLNEEHFHNNLHLRQLIEERGHNCLCLPTFSPFLNPLENVFIQWKGSVRSQEPQNVVQLSAALQNASHIISSEDTTNHFHRMEDYISKCVKSEVIIE